MNGGFAPLNEVLRETIFAVDLADISGPTIQIEFKGSGSGKINAPVGFYGNIMVSAYYNGVQYASGELAPPAPLEIKAGKNDPINITMNYIRYPIKLVGNGGYFNSNSGYTEKIVFTDNISSYLSNIAIPANEPSGKTGYNCRLMGWNWTANAGSALNPASTSLAKSNVQYYNFTLYAQWGSYTLGENGPCGGKIIYREETGFTVEAPYPFPPGSTPYSAYTAYYLEAHPTDPASGVEWAANNALVPGLSTTASDETDWGIGRGRMNTALILGADSTAPAALNCYVQGTGGKNDWFLPSKDELKELYTYRTAAAANANAYWSSSQATETAAWLHAFTNPPNSQATNSKTATAGQGYPIAVRAIRAF